MNNKTQLFFSLFSLMLLLLPSCSRVQHQTSLSSSEPTDSICTSFYVEDTEENIESTSHLKYYEDTSVEARTLLNVMGKMRKKDILYANDYQTICTSLFGQFGFAEGFGYELFQYFQKDILHNEEFAHYLNGKTTSYKDSVLVELVGSLCIDLGLEEYSYEDFVKDFPLFKDNVACKRKFEDCMTSWSIIEDSSHIYAQ